jgi:hypothetical protein
MVMRNKHDGAGANGWWDDLPPAVKRRVTPRPPAAEARPEPTDPADPGYRPAVLADLSRLAGLVLLVALGNLLFLLVALSFLAGRAPLGR